LPDDQVIRTARLDLVLFTLERLDAVLSDSTSIGKPGSNALGAPDAVELGYSVEPKFRRQGLAEEAIRGMMDWARARSIFRFIVSVSPSNPASLALAAKLGFSEITQVVDEEDGPEIVLELRK